MKHLELRERLIALIRSDEATRDQLAADGSLYLGYHPEMEAVHRANAEQLRSIIHENGWPGRSAGGEDGAEAAWRIAQHSIGEPEFMREAFRLVTIAVAQDDAPAWQAAYLDDRIRAMEGRPQRYGTQFDWDEEGRFVPWPLVEDPETVDERRAAVGLPPLAEIGQRHQVEVLAEFRPADLARRRQEMEEWARQTGWLE